MVFRRGSPCAIVRTREADWPHFPAVRRTFPSADYAPTTGTVIFDIGGNKYHSLPPDDSTPAERLRFLMEHAGKTAADLLPVFHQRSHVNEAPNGRRKVNPEQARQLGKMFSVKPALFL